jgi:hypothetical protein
MWDSYYDTTSDIDQTETELFNWDHQTSPDTAPHSRRPLSIGPAPAYKYLSASPPSTFGDKRSSPVYSNKAEFERHQEKVSQQQHHVLNVEMNHAQPIYTAIPTAISIETSTYHGPDHQPHFQAATHPGYHSQYVQHPFTEQHVAHGLSTSAPEAGEPWNMQHHQHHQQQQSRAPNWTYPGMPGALGESLRCRDCRPYADASRISIDLFSGRPASSGDQAVMAQGVGLIRYTSEETVAELTKEEKVGPDRSALVMTQLIRSHLLKLTARSTKGAEPISTTGFEEEANGAYCQREFALAFRMSRFTRDLICSSRPPYICSARDPGGRARSDSGEEGPRDQDVAGYRQTASTGWQTG